MSRQPAPTGYSRAQIAAHWITALLVVLAFVNHDSMLAAAKAVREGTYTGAGLGVMMHVGAGVLVLVFAVWRLVLRLGRGALDAPATEAPALRLAAQVTHASLYALLFALPLSGMLAWGGGLAAAGWVHGLLKPLILLAVALHVAAALFHAFWLRSGVMQRMLRPEK